MRVLTISAVLTESTGLILLARRKNSALWRLPGGAAPPGASVSRLLVSLCRRQVGVAPDFLAPLLEFDVLGRRVLVGRDEIQPERARACGWIEAVQWCQPNRLPLGIDPLTAMVISLTRSPQQPRPDGRVPNATATDLARAVEHSGR